MQSASQRLTSLQGIWHQSLQNWAAGRRSEAALNLDSPPLPVDAQLVSAWRALLQHPTAPDLPELRLEPLLSHDHELAVNPLSPSIIDVSPE